MIILTILGGKQFAARNIHKDVMSIKARSLYVLFLIFTDPATPFVQEKPVDKRSRVL